MGFRFSRLASSEVAAVGIAVEVAAAAAAGLVATEVVDRDVN